MCREHTISAATFHNWKARYGGMEPSQLKRVKELEGAQPPRACTPS
ncbi:MAG: transposase [Flavobacteriales bacterium]|nr:transposase [Flavobacteriales bacterium]